MVKNQGHQHQKLMVSVYKIVLRLGLSSITDDATISGILPVPLGVLKYCG